MGEGRGGEVGRDDAAIAASRAGHKGRRLERGVCGRWGWGLWEVEKGSAAGRRFCNGSVLWRRWRRRWGRGCMGSIGGGGDGGMGSRFGNGNVGGV